MEIADIRAHVSALLGRDCGELTPLARGFSGHRTYRADRVVVKVASSPGALEGTAHNLAVLGDLGVPVPRLLACADDILVLDLLPGRDLWDELPTMTATQMMTLASQIVDIQRRVGSLPTGSGCGFVPIGASAGRTWLDVVRQPGSDQFADPLPPDVAPLVPRLHEAIAAAEPYLARVTPVCFLDDITTKNVMMLDGELTGIVDVDVVCYGDPLFHVGLTAASVSANLPARCRFYIDELVRVGGLSDEQRQIVDLYEALFLIQFLGAEDPHGTGPWRVAAVSAARARLDALASSPR